MMIIRPLSLAERRTLALAAHPNKEIGITLRVCEKTVRSRFTAIYAKLGLPKVVGRRSGDRIRALMIALWLGFLKPADVSSGPCVHRERVL